MEKNESVLVSCGTKFHSDYMASQLDKHCLLNRTVTAHPKSRYLSRVSLQKGKIKFLPPLFMLGNVLNKLGLGNSRAAKFVNYRLPIAYDWFASLFIGESTISITWAWAGLSTIRKIKAKGGIAIVEECGSCNVLQNKVLEAEYQALGLRFNHKTPDFILQREIEEVSLADYVLCPSQYVATSFVDAGISKEKCIIIPYGANLNLFKPKFIPKDEFLILFVGTIGVRKGLIYLFKALEILKQKYNLKCLLIGSIEDQFNIIMEKYSSLFTHIPRVPHNELIEFYNKASVFVFPSLDEGMAYVQLEAMACGLPVVCTPNSGGDSVITGGVDGFIVPIKNEQVIADKIEYLYLNPSHQKKMGAEAAEKARKFSWDNYGDKLAEFIHSL
jgi:glycosyltransferase involved in cell wall biosynthesis